MNETKFHDFFVNGLKKSNSRLFFFNICHIYMKGYMLLSILPLKKSCYYLNESSVGSGRSYPKRSLHQLKSKMFQLVSTEKL